MDGPGERQGHVPEPDRDAVELQAVVGDGIGHRLGGVERNPLDVPGIARAVAEFPDPARSLDQESVPAGRRPDAEGLVESVDGPARIELPVVRFDPAVHDLHIRNEERRHRRARGFPGRDASRFGRGPRPSPERGIFPPVLQDVEVDDRFVEDEFVDLDPPAEEGEEPDVDEEVAEGEEVRVREFGPGGIRKPELADADADGRDDREGDVAHHGRAVCRGFDAGDDEGLEPVPGEVELRGEDPEEEQGQRNGQNDQQAFHRFLRSCEKIYRKGPSYQRIG